MIMMDFFRIYHFFHCQINDVVKVLQTTRKNNV